MSPRNRLSAPELALAECGNVIRKKAHRREIADPTAYMDELAKLQEILQLRPIRGLFERAARLALDMDHPIYDCFYLACAESAGSILVTADRRFAHSVAARADTAAQVRYIGARGFANWAENAAAT